jgi:putative ABC transport system ATP-binding protein
MSLPKDPLVTTIPTKTPITEVKKVEKVDKPLPTEQSKSDKKVLVDAKNICKSFYAGHEETKVLKNLSVQIHDEDFLIIVGPSGSGKSTLLHILLGLEIPTTGELNFLGKDLYKDTTEDIRSEFRKQHIGMVYQQPNWIKSMSVLENIAFPLILRGYRKELAHEIAFGALQEVHMEMHANQPPTELSGGQQQRVSLARCIVHNPEIIVADEPTGNLDYESGQEVMQLLQALNVKDKKTVIMVTHDIEYIKFANCAVQIFDGQVAGYYGTNNLPDLLAKLHTKHMDSNNIKNPDDTKTN